MPKFSFKVKDKEGRIRAGSLSASSLEQARRLIVDKGFQPLELVEVKMPDSMAEPKINIEKPKGGASRYHVGPAEPLDLKISPVDYLIDRLRPDSPILTGMIALFAVIGILWLAVGWVRTPPKPVETPEEAQQVKFKCVGAVAIQGIKDYGDVTLIVDFPQVPYQKASKWSDLKHPAEGRYQAEVEFQVAKAPTRFLVRAMKPGYKEASTKEMVVPQPGSPPLKVGDLELEPAPRR